MHAWITITRPTRRRILAARLGIAWDMAAEYVYECGRWYQWPAVYVQALAYAARLPIVTK